MTVHVEPMKRRPCASCPHRELCHRYIRGARGGCCVSGCPCERYTTDQKGTRE